MANVTVTIEVKSQPEKIQELYQTLQALLPTMRKDKGCLNCRISRDVEDGGVFFLISEWDEKGSFEDYTRSGSGSALLGAIDLLGESAKVRIGSNSVWEKIEALKRMRRDT
ncbi:MAG: putative quinol monooxygenase [Syntrophales bacterium]